jgi:hypothetical protein
MHTRGGVYEFNPRGRGIFSFDWDTLIILDACKYDVFAETATLPGTTRSRWTRAAATYDFIRANFTDRTLHDTVYVGGNSWFLRLRDDINAEVYRFINCQAADADVEFAHVDLRVPTPESVTQHALQALDEHPNKRLIIHYLQPHHPFIGPFGRSRFTQTSSSLLDVVAASGRSIADLRRAYRENLDLVLESVSALMHQLDGRTVVTADHGEMLGDRHEYIPMRDFGHHSGIFNAATTRVPWHVHESGARRHITAETPPPRQEADAANVAAQLRSLGYVV